MIKQLRYLCTLLLLTVASVAWGDEKIDVLNQSLTGVTGSSYTEWSGKTSVSDAVYAGQSAGGNSAIQLRSNNNNSGVVTTASGGTVTKISVTWNSNSTNGRTLNIYGKNTAYSAATDLYDTSKQGTLLGTIVNGTSTELEIDGNYTFIGFRSNSGALYLDEVKISWNAGETPSVEKPIFSPAAGTYTTAQDVTISCETVGATIYYTLDESEPNNESTKYSGAIPVKKSTTIKAIAYDATGASYSNVATATYNILNLQTIKEARTQGTGTVYTKGVVTSCVGSTAYIQDNTAAICVFGKALNKGDEISVWGTLDTYNGLLEIKNPTVEIISSGTTVEPTIKTIEDINNDDSGAKALQGWFVKIENAIVKNISDANTTIAQGDNSIVVRGISEEISVNNIISLTGNVGCFNTVQIVNPQDVTIVSIGAPNINADEEVKLDYNATSGKIDYTIDNPVDGYSLKAVTDADWISNVVVSENSVTFDVTNNDGTNERTAIFTLSYDGAEDVKVTVTQKHLVADVASLPFGFDGGKDDIENKEGLTQEGLDTDYGSSPKMKFNTTGDYLILHFDGTPGTLSFDIKGNSFSGGTFTVQTSVDGETYTDFATYTELGATQSEEFSNLGADIRYIKWIYTEKSSGNVALGNIVLKEPSNDPIINAEDLTIEADATSGEISYTITNSVEGTSLTASTETEWITNVSVGMEKVTFTTTANDGAERTGTITLSYGSVSKDVSITQKRAVVSGEVKYELVTSTENLTDGQYLIVSSLDEYAVAFDGSLETLDAISNNQQVTVTNNVVVASEKMSFVITAKEGGYSIKSNSGYYIGNTSDANALKSDIEDKFVNSITFDGANANIVSSDSYLRYNSASNQDRFRYYKSASYTNQQAIKLFKKISSTETEKGDVNGDGHVTIADVTALVNIILGKTTDYDERLADVDGANGITIADVTALVNIILGKTN